MVPMKDLLRVHTLFVARTADDEYALLLRVGGHSAGEPWLELPQFGAETSGYSVPGDRLVRVAFGLVGYVEACLAPRRFIDGLDDDLIWPRGAQGVRIRLELADVPLDRIREHEIDPETGPFVGTAFFDRAAVAVSLGRLSCSANPMVLNACRLYGQLRSG